MSLSNSASQRGWLAALTLIFLLLAGCRENGQAAPSDPAASPVAQASSQDSPLPAPPLPESNKLPVLSDPKPDVALTHDPQSFTQGLLFTDGALYESTGRNGESKVRRLDPESGAVRANHDLSPEFFGEGLASLGDTLYQLTWTSGQCLLYDRATLAPKGQLFYPGEGWGLTVSPEEKLLVFSDGSEFLKFLDPSNFIAKRTVPVTDDQGQPVAMLNELEWVNGEVWANIWLTDRIARIDPKSGKVLGWLVLSELSAGEHDGAEDVLNGIAYDPASDRLWITGKLWSKIYRFDGVKAKFFK